MIEPSADHRYFLYKRIVDVTLSLLGILLLMPLFLVVYVLIKAEDMKAPVIFKQQRVGKGEEHFYMYKFRSMVVDAEALRDGLNGRNELAGPVFKIKSDPRITKIGKFIRKTSIDELPQLFNVLKGEMSLVGPRPALPDEVAQYTESEKRRLQCMPGLTCYWQVCGRSSVGFDEWVELDVKYIKEQCLWVDFKLIIRTVFVLFGSRDAY
ncbi:sugar transferase [Planococcus sp. FY231025]|uniref:sugar transferase n=1 Tax=Planococcus sp. FY231025 TaxID=3455699 RepID=UPI003F8E1C61